MLVSSSVYLLLLSAFFLHSCSLAASDHFPINCFLLCLPLSVFPVCSHLQLVLLLFFQPWFTFCLCALLLSALPRAFSSSFSPKSSTPDQVLSYILPRTYFLKSVLTYLAHVAYFVVDIYLNELYNIRSYSSPWC